MRHLSKKEKKDIEYTLKERYKIKSTLIDNLKKKIVYTIDNVVFQENVPIAFYYNENVYPTLILLTHSEDFEIPYVIVDKGAVKFILNGADVFRPGIINISEDLKKDYPAIIVSEDNKLLALGISLMDHKDAISTNKGKVIKNIHWYGDKIFKVSSNK